MSAVLGCGRERAVVEASCESGRRATTVTTERKSKHRLELETNHDLICAPRENIQCVRQPV